MATDWTTIDTEAMQFSECHMVPITGLIAQNHAAGYHFFDEKTMEFFASSSAGHAHRGPGGTYFVTAEKTGPEDDTRQYSVRRFRSDASIETLGEMGDFGSDEDAAKQMAHLMSSLAHFADVVMMHTYGRISDGSKRVYLRALDATSLIVAVRDRDNGGHAFVYLPPAGSPSASVKLDGASYEIAYTFDEFREPDTIASWLVSCVVAALVPRHDNGTDTVVDLDGVDWAKRGLDR